MDEMSTHSKGGKIDKTGSGEKVESKQKTKMPGFQGNLYQSKLLMLYLYRGLFSQYNNFELGTEIEEADKFDDLVFKYKRDINGQEQDHFILLQAKHKSETNVKITFEEIFTNENIDFGLMKYYNAYKKAKSHEMFKNGVIEHMIIHRNANFDMFGKIPEKNPISKSLKNINSLIKELKAEQNSVLSLSKVGGGKYYQFKSNLVLPILKPMLSDYYKIAQTLIKSLEKGKYLSPDGILKNYDYLLATDVINMKTKTFQDDFWDEECDNTESSIGRKKLRSALIEVFNDDSLNKDEILKNKFVMRKNFGNESTSQKWPADETNEDIQNFLKIFVFAVEQPNDSELQKIILSQIDQKYKNYDANFVYSFFSTEIQKWMIDGMFVTCDSRDVSDCRFISSKSAKKFFEKTKRKFDEKVLKGPTNDYDKFIETNCFNFDNSELENPIKVFLSSEKQMLNIISGEIIISSIKVYNELVKNSYPEILYLRMSSSNESSIDLIIEAFESDSNNDLLVIESDLDQIRPNVREKNIEIICINIINVIQNTKNKKIIVISKEEDILINNLQSEFSTETELKKIKDTENIVINFSDDSRKLFLNTPINFQGFKVELSDLVNSDDLEKIKNQDILLKILKNEEISISKQIDGIKKNMQNYYIYRKFVYVIKSEKNVYMFSNIKEQDLYDCKVKQKFELNNESLENLITNDEYEIFERSTKQNCSMNIFLLRQKNSLLNLLKKSKEPINVADFEETVNSESNCCEINLVSAIAGMGKSTLFTNLSRKIKEHNHKLWIIKIDLNDVSTKLKEIKDSGRVDDQTAISFLHSSANIASELEISIFECHLSRKNIVLYLDGFDEICPGYKEVVLKIITKLENNTKIKEIWISTRPYDSILNDMKVYFEKMLVKRYEIEPFTENNQKEYLNNFWKETTDINKIKFDIFVEKLFYLLKNKIEDKRMEFLGVALHTNMIAVTFKDIFEEFQNNASSSELNEKELENMFLEMLQLSKLYEKFIKSKYDFYHKNKVNLNIDKEATRDIVEKSHEESRKQMKLLALDSLCNENQLEIFLTESETNDLKIYKDDIKEKGDFLGIANRIIDGKTHFVHRTFAEYFVASFFVENISKESQKSKTVVKYFLNNMINGDNLVICKFIDSMLQNDKMSQYTTNYDVVQKIKIEIIHFVLEKNFQNIANFLITCGVNLNYSYKNKSVLHLASVLRNPKEKEKSILKLIVEKMESDEIILKSFLNSEESDGNTPLFLAVKHGILDNIEVLVGVYQKYGILKTIILNENNKNQNILHLAVENDCDKSLDYVLNFLKNEPETLKFFLIKNGEYGDNPIGIAALIGKWIKLKAMLSICSDLQILDTVLTNVNTSKKNVLHHTAGGDFEESVFINLLDFLKNEPETLKQILIKKDGLGHNSFTIAALHGKLNILKTMVAVCKELKIIDNVVTSENKNDENVLHKIAGRYFEENVFIYLLNLLKNEPEILKTLLMKKDRNGNNPLNTIALKQQPNKLKAVLTICNELKIVDTVLVNENTSGENILHQTATEDFKDDMYINMLDLLISKPETLKTLLIGKDRNGNNPLNKTVLKKQPNKLKAILDICCNLKIVDTVLTNENKSGKNVMHQTAEKDIEDNMFIYLLDFLKSNPETLKTLLIKKDRYGNDPFTIAVLDKQSNKHKAILDICNDLENTDTILANENTSGENVLHHTAGENFEDDVFTYFLEVLNSEPGTLKKILMKKNQRGNNPLNTTALNKQQNKLLAMLPICKDLKIIDNVLANENMNGETVLHQTAGKYFEDAAFINLLDFLKSEPETLKKILIQKDQHGNNPFTIAALNGQSNKLKTMLAISDEFTITDIVLANENSSGENVLHQMAGKDFEDDLFVYLLELLKNKPETLKKKLIVKDQHGNNPLNTTALKQQPNKLKAMLVICNELEIVDSVLVNENTSGENILHQTAVEDFEDDLYIYLIEILKSEPETLKKKLISKDQYGNNLLNTTALKQQPNKLKATLAICNELKILDTVLANENTSGENILHQTAGKDFKDDVFINLLDLLKSEPETLKKMLIKKDQQGNNPSNKTLFKIQPNKFKAILTICDGLEIIDIVLANENTNGKNVLHRTAEKYFTDDMFIYLLDFLKSYPETLKNVLIKKDGKDNNPFTVAALNGQPNKLKAMLAICNELKIVDIVLANENTYGKNVLHQTAGKYFMDEFFYLLDILKSVPEILKTLLVKKDKNGNNPFNITVFEEQPIKLKALLAICNELEIQKSVITNENTSGENIIHQTAGDNIEDDLFICLLDLLKSESEILKNVLIKKDILGNNPFTIAAICCPFLLNKQSNKLEAILAICNELKIMDIVLTNENVDGENVLHQTAGKDFKDDVFIYLLDLLKSKPEILKILLIKKDRHGNNPFDIAALNEQSNKLQTILAIYNELKIVDIALINENISP